MTWTHHNGRDIPDHELNDRLTTSRCVWCGGKLGGTGAPDDMFCCEEHQKYWHLAGAKLNSGGVDVRQAAATTVADQSDRSLPPPTWLGDQRPARLRDAAAPAPGAAPAAAEPADPHREGDTTGRTWTLPTSDNTAIRVTTGPGLPPEFDYSVLTTYGDAVYGIAPAPDTTQVEPVTATHDTPTRTDREDFITQYPVLPGYGHVLRAADPPPEPRTGWPITYVTSRVTAGWRVALPGGPGPHDDTSWAFAAQPLRPLQHCPRCDRPTRPVPITGLYPVARLTFPADPVPAFTRWVVDPEWVAEPRTQTRICCHACLLPYPGPTVVPLYKPPSDHHPVWSYQTCTTTGWQEAHATEELIRRGLLSTGRLQSKVWDPLYREALLRGSVGGCCLPGCNSKPTKWTLLTGVMTWQGYTWRPGLEGAPLRLGLCPDHYYTLINQMHIVTNRHVGQRWSGSDVIGLHLRHGELRLSRCESALWSGSSPRSHPMHGYV